MDAIPVFGVADKRYMIAAKIIETFFDREYNPNVNKIGLLVGVDVLKYKDESDKIISRDFSIAKK